MWREGYTAPEIAEEIGKSTDNVRMFASRNREKLDLEHRGNPEYKGRPSGDTTEFEKAWKGSVPRGHWLITKPWKLA